MLVVDIVPVRVVDIVPPRFSVVDMVPVLVVEIVPALVVEIVPVFANVVADTATTNNDAQTLVLKLFIALLLRIRNFWVMVDLEIRLRSLLFSRLIRSKRFEIMLFKGCAKERRC